MKRMPESSANSNLPRCLTAVGVDIIETERFRGRRYDSRFIKSVFTESEIEYCTARRYCHEHYAARFACKEAVIKALSRMKISASLREIEVVSNEDGSPTIKIWTPGAEHLDVSVSMSHSRQYALAVAIIIFSFGRV